MLGLGLGAALAIACGAGVGERCICAQDCKKGLACVSGGRELRDEECIPAAADNEPGECVENPDTAGADEDDDGGALYMDLGSKRDFDPGAPPDPPATTSAGSGSDSSTGPEPGSTSDSSSSGSGSSSSTGAGSTSGSTGGSGTGTSSSGTGL